MSQHPSQEHLSAFLDGELDEAEAIAVESALEADPALREQLDRLKAVQQLLRTHGRSRAPEGFTGRVLQAARDQAPVAAPWWRRPFGVPLEGVLVAAAAALVLVIAVPRGGELVEPPAEAAAGMGQAEVPAPAPATEAPTQVDADDAVVDAGAGDEEVAAVRDGGAERDAGAKAAPEPVAQGTAEEVGTDKLAATNMDNAAPAPAGGSAGGTAEPEFAGAGFAVALYSEDEDILGALQRLAAEHGGVIRDGRGKILKTGVLEQQETRIVVDVPADRVSSFNRALGALGARIETTGTTDLTAGPSIQVPIRVVWVANGPSKNAAPPPAAARQSDALEAAEPE